MTSETTTAQQTRKVAGLRTMVERADQDAKRARLERERAAAKPQTASSIATYRKARRYEVATTERAQLLRGALIRAIEDLHKIERETATWTAAR